MLIAKRSDCWKAIRLRDSLRSDQRTMGGSRETEENELAVMATSSSPAFVVITVTPVPNCPKARRNALWSRAGSPSSRRELSRTFMRLSSRNPQPGSLKEWQHVLKEVGKLILEVDERDRGPGKAHVAHAHHLFGDMLGRSDQRIGSRAAREALAVEA